MFSYQRIRRVRMLYHYQRIMSVRMFYYCRRIRRVRMLYYQCIMTGNVSFSAHYESENIALVSAH
jgi:hypothetical protein